MATKVDLFPEDILEWCRLVAKHADSTVLILGESGTGKERLVRFIHEMSSRKAGPFEVVNCGSFPGDLFESQLFGYVKGAFTGAGKDTEGMIHQVNGGSLMLDEIGDLPLPQQVKVLRLLQKKRFFRVGGVKEEGVDCRFFAATNKDLLVEIEQGRFREDLYYRISDVVNKLKSLRDTRDILERAIDVYCMECEITVTSEAREMLLSYPWPGNKRELLAFMKNLQIVSDGAQVDKDVITRTWEMRGVNIAVRAGTAASIESRVLKDRRPLIDVLEEEKQYVIAKAMERSGGVKSKAAALLGMTPQKLQYHIRKASAKS